MTLPFADKPVNSRVYQDLKTKVLQNLTADEFDSLKASMFSEGVNGLEDEYRRLLLLGLASDKVSVAGPLANSGEVKTYTQSNDALSPVVRPPVGEVWQIIAIAVANSAAPSGSSNYFLFLSDEAMLNASPDIPTAGNDLFYSSATSASTNIAFESIVEDHNAQPFVLTNSMFLRPYNNFDGMATGATTEWRVAYVRIR